MCYQDANRTITPSEFDKALALFAQENDSIALFSQYLAAVSTVHFPRKWSCFQQSNSNKLKNFNSMFT